MPGASGTPPAGLRHADRCRRRASAARSGTLIHIISSPNINPSSTATRLTDLQGLEPETADLDALLAALAERFGNRLVLACSFQKEESVLLDHIQAIAPGTQVFALDTHVLFPETYALWQEVESRYGITIQAVSGPSLGHQAAAHGDRLWERDPNACCAIRKVAPLRAYLQEFDCWITGIRRSQSPTRAHAPVFAYDDAFGLYKANPLAAWSDEDVMVEIAVRGLPVNDLHQQGYASIGCTYCTRPGDTREGRWAGAEKTECGLHGRA